MKENKKKDFKMVPLLAILAAAVVLALWNPFEMDVSQRVLLSALVFTVATWATAAMHKDIACVLLLAVFFVFGKTPPLEVVNFAWSPTMFLIITSTLLSVGIMKTGMIHKQFETLFRKSASSMFRILLLPYVFGIVLVFLIPQAFARVIIIGAIYHSLLRADTNEEIEAKQALIFNGFMGITMTYMLFSSGDIVLNQAAINFSGEEVQSALTFGNWFNLMALPSLVASVLVLLLTYSLFREELKGFHVGMIETSSFETGPCQRGSSGWASA